MLKRDFYVSDVDCTVTVYECKRQCDILNILDSMLECVTKDRDVFYIFADDTFYIEYHDGSYFCADCCGLEGNYRKRGIKRIIYTNCNDTMVYGNYEVNIFGCVS